MANKQSITDFFPKRQRDDKSPSGSVTSVTSNQSVALPPQADININPHRPPKTLVFPKVMVGGRKRSCQHYWFDRFPWLLYDI